MIQLQTKVNIIDNSGGSVGRCIKILSPHGRLYAKIGDVILVSIQETLTFVAKGQTGRNPITRGSMYKALVVRTKVNSKAAKNNKLTKGVQHMATYDDNSVILLKSNTGPGNSYTELTPIGTRIKGPISIGLTVDKLAIGHSQNIKNLLTKVHENTKADVKNTTALSIKDRANKYQKILSLTKLHY